MEFTKEFLQEMVSNSVYDEITDTSRWSEYHEMVFDHEGKYYMVEYSQGKTEMQDEYPFDDLKDGELVFCYEVAEKKLLLRSGL